MNKGKKIERESIILKEAKSLIWSNGYKDTTMLQIASNCGLAVGTLYNYFASKMDILITLFKNELKIILKQGEPIVKNPESNLQVCFMSLFKEYSNIFTLFNKDLWVKFLSDIAVRIDVINIEGELWKYFEQLRIQMEYLIISIKEKKYIRENIDERVLSMLLFNMFYFHLREYIYSSYTVETVLENLGKQMDILIVGLENKDIDR